MNGKYKQQKVPNIINRITYLSLKTNTKEKKQEVHFHSITEP